MIIGIDIDDVCCNLIDTWLAFYNRDWNDNLTKRQITDWNIAKFVSVECNTKIYKYIENPNIYDYIHVKPYALEAINILRKKHRVIFVTSFVQGTSGRKFRWLNDNGFDVVINDYIEARDKSLVNYDVLIDDNYENYMQRKNNILFTAPWNIKYPTRKRINGWEHALSGRNLYFNKLAGTLE